MSWSTVAIKEACKNVTSGGTPKSTNEAFYNPKEIPWLKTAEVNYCRIYDTETYISQEGLNKSSAKIIPENSVIIAMYGQGDTAGRVAINKIPLCTNQACCNLIINHDKADYRYIYYTLSTLYDKLVSLKNGGAQPNLNAGIIKNIEIPFPNIETQRRIADILSAYDDLIENNRKQIKLLEEAAQRLYKEWFVDLHFPGWESTRIVDGVPDGWSVCRLDEIGCFRRGKTITGKDITHGTIPVVAGGLEPAYYHNVSITQSPVITVSGSGANAGFTRLYHEKIWASDCSYLDASECDFLFFVYCFLQNNRETILNMQKGAAQPHVYAKDINAMECILPKHELIELFETMVSAFFEKTSICTATIKEAQEARDRLLPKLMSGEIEV